MVLPSLITNVHEKGGSMAIYKLKQGESRAIYNQAIIFKHRARLIDTLEMLQRYSSTLEPGLTVIGLQTMLEDELKRVDRKIKEEL